MMKLYRININNLDDPLGNEKFLNQVNEIRSIKEIFEDMYLIKGLTKLYPEKKFNFTRSTELDEYSNSANDKYSTWFHHQFEKHTIGDHTRYLLNKLTG